jgi:hypothetical protein
MFPPDRRRGILLQSAATAFLFIAAAVCLLSAAGLPVGSGFVLLILLGLLFAVPLPFLAYRLYALATAVYALERDGLRLRWGLHTEDIPIQAIEWVRPASDLVLPLPLPRLCWPGALLGAVNVPDLGPVEFLASETATLLLIATPARIYAVSPADSNAFLKAFRRATEMGSIEALPPRSARPAVSLRRVWRDLPARLMIAGGLALSLLVFLAVGLGIGGRVSVSLGFTPARAPLPPVPAAQALLLPFLAASAFVLDFILGYIFFRRAEQRAIAYVFWLGGLITPLIFLLAAWFIL